MSEIACLAWGSLVWDAGELKVESPWFPDGPAVQAEFLRHSRDDRITLVLDDSAMPVPALWAKMAPPDMATAVESLRAREGTDPKYIGVWTRGDPSPSLIADLPEWAGARNLRGVIWTSLPRKFANLDRAATADEVVRHLGRLTGQKREAAERYIRQAPAQIDTIYRRKIIEAFGWQ